MFAAILRASSCVSNLAPILSAYPAAFAIVIAEKKRPVWGVK
jgi:hypothetical protein